MRAQDLVLKGIPQAQAAQKNVSVILCAGQQVPLGFIASLFIKNVRLPALLF